VLVSSPLLASEYEEVIVDPGRAILPDTTVAPGGDFLYVLSTAKLWKLSTTDCRNDINNTTCTWSRDGSKRNTT
ncbi:hypothetical protein L9F63_024304, partial [Diploptera punctata]